MLCRIMYIYVHSVYVTRNQIPKNFEKFIQFSFSFGRFVFVRSFVGVAVAIAVAIADIGVVVVLSSFATSYHTHTLV